MVRNKLRLPMVALVGYTNVGKSSLLKSLSNTNVLVEDMLFATLDPTTRKVQLPRSSLASESDDASSIMETSDVQSKKGPEFFLTDTVGFISKLPLHLIAAFR